MKGVINKGIQELVEKRFGPETWEKILAAAGCDEPSFSPSLDYPDQMTVDLVMATARCLNLSPDETMIEFGKYPPSSINFPILLSRLGIRRRW